MPQTLSTMGVGVTDYQKSNLFGFVPPKNGLCSEASKGDAGPKKKPCLILAII